MKILLENDETGEFLTAADDWTKNPQAGKPFATTIIAWRAGRQHAIGRFNVVCHIRATHQFVNLHHGRGSGSPVPVGAEGAAVS